MCAHLYELHTNGSPRLTTIRTTGDLTHSWRPAICPIRLGIIGRSGSKFELETSFRMRLITRRVCAVSVRAFFYAAIAAVFVAQRSMSRRQIRCSAIQVTRFKRGGSRIRV